MVETWGQLDKSQVDNQKIDGAISDAIDDHEADADAHVEAGESLQSHKAAAIIDHVAGSVLVDKLPMVEHFLVTNFDSLDRWVLVGSQYGTNWPGVTLWADGVAPVKSSLYAEAEARLGTLDGDKDSLFHAAVRIDEQNDKVVIFGNTYLIADDAAAGYGFKIIDTTLYGFWYTHAGLETTVLTGVDLSYTHTYRAVYDATSRTVTFFVDGVQKGSIEHADYLMNDDWGITFFLNCTVEAEAYLVIVNLMITQKII